MYVYIYIYVYYIGCVIVYDAPSKSLLYIHFDIHI